MSARYSQPIPEDVFGDPEAPAISSGASTGTGNSNNAVNIMYSRGDAVWYKQRDGSEVPAKVVAVDMAVYPPSYGVMIGDSIRETEASRLKTRGSIKTKSSDLVQHSPPEHQQAYWQGTSLQPTISGASFGSFTDAADSFMHLHTDIRPTHSQAEPSRVPKQSTSLQAWHPSQESPGHQWPSSPQCQAPQGSMAQPWPSSPHWQALQGSTNQPWPLSPQWAQAPQQPVSAVNLNPSNSTSSYQLPPNSNRLSNGNLAASSSALQSTSTAAAPYLYNNGISHAMQEHPLSDAGHAAKPDHANGDGSDDDGFGEFTVADHVSHSTANAPVAVTLQSADRSAPLSLSLFGEDSATSFADELPAALPVAPLWNPAWLPPSPSHTHHAQHPQQPQHAQHAQQAPGGQHQQQSLHSHLAAVPHMELLPQQAVPDTEDDSDFGSFTGNAAQPSSWLPSAQAESAQEYIDQADQQAPPHFHSVISSAGMHADEGSGAAGKAPVRPAAAAATASLLQSMNRSAPISLGLFGEESYEDPVLEVPAPAAVWDAAVPAGQEAVSSSPRQMPSPAEPAVSLGQAHVSQHEFKPQHAFPPEFKFKAQHDFEPSWQHAHDTNHNHEPSSAGRADTAEDDFSPSWQQADENNSFGSNWQVEPVPGSPRLTAPGSEHPHAFAATWPQLKSDTDSPSRQQDHLPARHAMSGPISLELFGMEDQEDRPLEIPANTLTGTPPSPHPAEDDGPQELEDTLQSQQAAVTATAGRPEGAVQAAVARQTSQPATAWQSETAVQAVVARQTSPGPISLELFGMEEAEDAPLELPVQATITVLPIGSSMSASLSLPTGGEPEGLLPGSQYDDWQVQALLIQVCAQELSRGQQVWSQVVANDAVESFQTDPNGAAYLAALQHIWRIALLLQAAADLHGLAQTAQPQHRAAFELASRQSMGAVVGEADPQQQLAGALGAHQVQSEVAEVAAAAAEWMRQHASSDQGPSSHSLPSNYKGLCRLCLVPTELVQLPTLQLQPDVECLAPAAALWTNRIGKSLAGMPLADI